MGGIIGDLGKTPAVDGKSLTRDLFIWCRHVSEKVCSSKVFSVRFSFLWKIVSEARNWLIIIYFSWNEEVWRLMMSWVCTRGQKTMSRRAGMTSQKLRDGKGKQERENWDWTSWLKRGKWDPGYGISCSKGSQIARKNNRKISVS